MSELAYLTIAEAARLIDCRAALVEEGLAWPLPPTT